jgi:pyruvate formate-lyase activating enzyme-like uncharacterized protein
MKGDSKEISMKQKKRFYTGDLAQGCRLCERGAKLVLFVTGLCGSGCVFCPLSEKRRDRDVAWANEREVSDTADIIEEAERMNALGAGITGGDPLLKLERTLEYISLLKKRFGGEFHIHLYTGSPVSKGDLLLLRNAGLDEIRFHLTGYENHDNEMIWKSIESSINQGLNTGIEIPAIPGTEEAIASIANRLKDMGGSFLNLNELEFSDTNLDSLERLGYVLKHELSYAASGSEETAKKAMKQVPDFNIHFCSSSYKDGVQLKNRLLRTAHNIAKPYETVTSEGLLLKGAIELKSNDFEGLRQRLMKSYDIPEGLIAVDSEKARLETSAEITIFLHENHRAENLICSIIEEYPTADRLEVEKDSLFD